MLIRKKLKRTGPNTRTATAYRRNRNAHTQGSPGPVWTRDPEALLHKGTGATWAGQDWTLWCDQVLGLLLLGAGVTMTFLAKRKPWRGEVVCSRLHPCYQVAEAGWVWSSGAGSCGGKEPELSCAKGNSPVQIWLKTPKNTSLKCWKQIHSVVLTYAAYQHRHFGNVHKWNDWFSVAECSFPSTKRV